MSEDTIRETYTGVIRAPEPETVKPIVQSSRIGRLLSGNKAFDLSVLPKCGASARSTGLPCQQIGNLKNGRCRFHGGKSTGPKTKEGLGRISRAALKTAEISKAIGRLERLLEDCERESLSGYLSELKEKGGNVSANRDVREVSTSRTPIPGRSKP